MAAWADILQIGKFGGVEFDFVSVRDDHSNELDQQKYPNRPGTFIQPRARNGARFDVLAIFIEDDYPTKMDELIEQLDDGGVVKEFIHPVFGAFRAACERFTVSHDAEDAADSATVQITFLEHTEDSGGLKAKRNTTPARANAVDAACQVALEALSVYQTAVEAPNNNPYVLQVQGAITAAEEIAESFESTGDEQSALEVQTQANGALATIEVAVAAGADYDTFEEHDLNAALVSMAGEVSAMAGELIAAKPPLNTYMVQADTNLLTFVHGLYGDSARADEVLALNSIPDPSLIPAGFRIMAYGA